MGLLITRDDFDGKFRVGQTNFDSLDLYIERYEEKFLIELLGVTLFDLFKAAYQAGLVTPPLAAPYKVIFDPIRLDDAQGHCENKIRISNGMKLMVLGLVWFEYIRELKIKIVSGGAVVDDSETSKITDIAFMYQRYNEAVNDFQTIQWYIQKNIGDYATFNGIKKSIAHWSL